MQSNIQKSASHGVVRKGRRSIRLPEYDYASPGEYFVTICIHRFAHLLGEVEDGMVRLSEIGEIVREEWLRTAVIRTNIRLDEFVVMPNHVHGIVVIQEDARRGTMHRAPTIERFGHPTSNSLSTIIRGFNASTTKRVNILRGTRARPLWQRGFYEHIIRDDRDLHHAQDDIRDNPARWSYEKETPENLSVRFDADKEPW